MKILILATSPKGNGTQDLVDAGKKRGHEMRVLNPMEMYLLVSNVNKNDRLYWEEERIYKNSVDAVITRIGGGLKHGAAIVQHIRQNMGIYCTQSASGMLNASDKLRTTQMLSLNGLRTPKTVYAKESKNPKLLIDLVGGLPVIVKGITGSQGANVVILETILSANSVLESYYNSKTQILIQEFIEPDETGAKDIRAIVLGGKVICAMQRIAPKDSFKANVSLGAEAKPIKLTEDQKDLCIEACKAIGLDTAGVDIMTDNDGRDYVIEVNGNHGWKIANICKDVNIAEEYIKFVEESYKIKDQRDFIPHLDDLKGRTSLLRRSWEVERLTKSRKD